MNAHTETAIENNGTYPIIKTVAQFRAYLDESYNVADDASKFTNEEFNHILNWLFDTMTVEHNAKKPTSVGFIKALNSTKEVLDEIMMALDTEIDALIVEAAEIAEGPHPENAPVPEPDIDSDPLATNTEKKAAKKAKEKAKADADLEPTDDVSGIRCSDRKGFRTKARAWCRKYNYSWDIVNGVYVVDRTTANLPVIYVFYDEDASIIDWAETKDDAIEVKKATRKTTKAEVDETLADVDALLAN